MANNRFPLAGLLRLRKLEKDVAASELARTRRTAGDLDQRRANSRTLLANSAAEGVSPAAILSIAAARASSASMLVELRALSSAAERDVVRATAAHDFAMSRELGIEKLEEKHASAAAAAALAAEQTVLDDLTGRAWHIAHSQETP